MSRALLVRSIPLSRDVSQAWRSADTHFARRDRTPDSIVSIAGDRPIINLGNSGFLPTVTHGEGIWNEATNIRCLLNPLESREVLGSLMPTNKFVGPDWYWVKGAGFGGRNKHKVWIETEREHEAYVNQASWNDGEVQLHIDGTEYRVITVGSKVVQVNERSGENGNRSYQWVGVRAAPQSCKNIARSAVSLLQGDNVIGWDIIVHDSGDGYVLEGNSCPGVNEATASRILDAVHGVSYA